MSSVSLNVLPLDVRGNICEFLDTQDLSAVGAVSSLFNEIVKDTPSLWTTVALKYPINLTDVKDVRLAVLNYFQEVNKECLDLMDPKEASITRSVNCFLQLQLIKDFLQRFRKGIQYPRRSRDSKIQKGLSSLWLTAAQLSKVHLRLMLQEAPIAIPHSDHSELKASVIKNGDAAFCQILIEHNVPMERFDLIHAVSYEPQNNFQGHLVTMIMESGVPFPPEDLTQAMLSHSITGVRAALAAGAVPTRELMNVIYAHLAVPSPEVAEIDRNIKILLRQHLPPNE